MRSVFELLADTGAGFQKEEASTMNRRTFAAVFAGSIASRRWIWEQVAGVRTRTVFYSAVGGDLTLYSMDIDEFSLVKRNTLTLPANIQYAWPHPSKQYLYVVSSGGGPGVACDQNLAHTFRIDS